MTLFDKLREIEKLGTPAPWKEAWGPLGSEDGPWVHAALCPDHEEGEDGDHDEADAKAQCDARLLTVVRSLFLPMLDVVEAAEFSSLCKTTGCYDCHTRLAKSVAAFRKAAEGISNGQ